MGRVKKCYTFNLKMFQGIEVFVKYHPGYPRIYMFPKLSCLPQLLLRYNSRERHVRLPRQMSSCDVLSCLLF